MNQILGTLAILVVGGFAIATYREIEATQEVAFHQPTTPQHHYLDHVYVANGFYQGSHCRIKEHGEIVTGHVFYIANCKAVSKDGKLYRFLDISVDESDLTIDETDEEP